MSRSSGPRANELSKEITRQIGQPANTRFLRALPLFRIDEELPEALDCLLREVDRAERQRNQRRSKSR